MDYKEYLKSAQWKKLRSAARYRAGNCCEMCGGAADHVHHVKYPKQYSHDRLENLIVLCETCHAKSHGIRGPFCMQNEITIFKFGQLSVSTIVINGENLFRTTDVMNAIGGNIHNYLESGYTSTRSVRGSIQPPQHIVRSVLNGLDDDEKILVEVDNPDISGTTRQETWITEPGVYGVVLKFKTDKSKLFKRWLTHDVLPSLRKTGGYNLNASGNSLLDQAKILVQTIEELDGVKKEQRNLISRQDILETKVVQITGELHFQTARMFLQGKGINPQSIYKGTKLTFSAKLGGWCHDASVARGIATPPKLSEGTFQVNQWPIDLLCEGMESLGITH